MIKRNRKLKLLSLGLTLSLLMSSTSLSALTNDKLNNQNRIKYIDDKDVEDQEEVADDNGESADKNKNTTDSETDNSNDKDDKNESLNEVIKPQLINHIEPLEDGEGASRALDSTDKKIAESNDYELYFSESSLAIKAKAKKDGYVWSSAVPKEKLENLSGVWKTFMQAPVVVEYKDLNRASTTMRDYPELKDSKEIENGVKLTLYYPKLMMSLDIDVFLDGDEVNAQINDDSFNYDEGENRKLELSGIMIFPFWGAVDDKETSGYLFIPDGPGALIRFGEAKPYRSPYQERIYGRDEGISRIGISLLAIPAVSTENMHMPVYGVSHGNKKHASLTHIKSGAEFADIFASPAGVKIDFFWISNIFNYIETFFQPTGRAGKTFPYVFKTPNKVNPHVSFNLLRDDEADYVGMANKYKEILQEEDKLPEQSDLLKKERNFPIMLHALMAEQEKALFFKRTKTVTKIQNLLDWLPELLDMSGNGLIYSLHGAQNKGVSGHKLADTGISSRVGGERDFNKLHEEAKKNNFQLLINTDLAVGNETQIPKNEMLYNVDRATAWRYTQNPIYDKDYFMNIRGQKRLMNQLAGDQKFDANLGLDISSLGFTLFSDYEKGNLTDRGFVRNELEAYLNSLSEKKTVYLDQAHDYFWKGADAIYNVSTRHSAYAYETDSVPFLQIVLSGTTPMFSRYLNFGAQDKNSLVTLVDYNVYPNFLVTEKPSSELMDSNTQNVYFSQFDSLKSDIKSAYSFVSSILDPVRGQKIVARDIPASHISVTQYENGMKVVANYSNYEYDFEGTKIDAHSAALIK